MTQKVLVVYATKFGSTKEVAEKVGEIIRSKKIRVDVRNVNTVKDISAYSAVILGTAIRMGKPVSDAFSFIKKYKDDIKNKSVAFFSVGLYMKEDTPENREKATKCLLPLIEQVENPVSIGLFGGKIDYSTMPLLLRWTFSKDTSGELQEGDWRDWDTISSWVDELLPRLESSRVV